MNKTQQALFDKWYMHYPKKVSVGAAEKAWEKLKPDEELTDEMIRALDAQKRYRKECEKASTWIADWPGPGPWLNQRRWRDEIGSTAEQKEKQNATICKTCKNAPVHGPKFNVCMHCLQFDELNKLRCDFDPTGRVRFGLQVPELRKAYETHPEIHELRGQSAIKWCKHKIKDSKLLVSYDKK